MPSAVPSCVPREVRAGDSIAWQRQLPDYLPADGWSLKYTIIGPTAVYSITASVTGTGYTIAVAPDVNPAWTPGRYTVTEFVEKDGARHTLATTPLRILQNLASAMTGVDLRSHARKVLDAIEAWLETKARVAGMTRLGDREIQNYPLPDLLTMRDKYRAEVAREDAQSAGVAPGRLLTRL